MSSLPARRLWERSIALWIVILLGTALRLVDLDRPVAQRTPSTWHESDYVQIARAFLREDPNPLRPRVDWRGTTTGEVEVELPVLPWLAAMLYRVLGYDESILRWLAAACSVASLVVFLRLTHRVLEPPAALLATAAFAVHPLPLALASSMQPEPLQVLLMCAAGLAIERWHREGGTARLCMASSWVGAAVLAKGPAAHLGLLLAFLVLRRKGWRAVLDLRVLGAAGFALIPAVAWYGWAHALYLETGLSMGLSNETHFLSTTMLEHPGWMKSLIRIEARDVFAYGALPLVACAALAPFRRLEPIAAWYGAVVVFYVVAADTCADAWSFYYHVNSVVPACLLLGLGFTALRERAAGWARTLAWVLALTALGSVGLQTVRMHIGMQPDIRLEALRRACLELSAAIPPDALIVVRGGERFDPHGHPLAYNESMAFAWMDRKGWNYAIDDLSLAELQRLARAGGRFWLAQPEDLRDPEFRDAVARSFRRVKSSGGFELFDLRGR